MAALVTNVILRYRKYIYTFFVLFCSGFGKHNHRVCCCWGGRGWFFIELRNPKHEWVSLGNCSTEIERLSSSLFCHSQNAEVPALTHCGLEGPFGNIDIGQYWFRYWLVDWWRLAVIWTNINSFSLRPSGIHPRVLVTGILKMSIPKWLWNEQILNHSHLSEETKS